MVNKLKRRAGYTMTEMMITVLIVGIVSAMGAGMLLQINRFFMISRTKLDLQREARAIMYVITRNLRQAQSDTITISRNASTQPFFSKITFTKQQGTTMSFQQNGDNLEQVVGNRTRVLSKSVRYLAFTFPRSDDMGIVSVSMTLENRIYQGRTKALHMASEKVQVMNE
ncbi:MAG: prepilin-type N-terminal cleavage/methylation domain-containing protein [Elusimicrobiota bacterium]|nr:MAG: prepilin-type N-terminal cleavage/methylation domain-containing protein [Elusimicrobiota bacterium]